MEQKSFPVVLTFTVQLAIFALIKKKIMLILKVNEEIILKELDIKNAKALFELIDSGRVYLREWLSWVDETRTVEDSILYIQSVSQGNVYSGRYVLEIWFKNNLAGLIDFHNGNKINMAVEIGYWLGERYQGKGIMTSSCKKCINYAFEEMGFNRIIIKCAVGNLKSQAIPKRLGFKFEGIEREGQNLNGHFTDLVVFLKLKKDWDNLNGRIIQDINNI